MAPDIAQILVVCALSQTAGTQEDALVNRLRTEAPEALKRLEQRLAQSHATYTTSISAGSQKDEKKWEYTINKGLFLGYRYRQKATNVYIYNDNYTATLKKELGQDFFSLVNVGPKAIEPDKKGPIEDSTDIRDEIYLQVFAPTYLLNESVIPRLASIAANIRSCRTTKEANGTHLRFEIAQGPLTKQFQPVYAAFDPDNLWCLTEYEVAGLVPTKTDEWIPTVHNVKLTYQPNLDGWPRLKKIHHSFDRNKSSVLVTLVTTVTEMTYRAAEPNEFTLSAFDLPEPAIGHNSERFTYWYFYVVGALVLGCIALLVLRKIRQENSRN